MNIVYFFVSYFVIAYCKYDIARRFEYPQLFRDHVYRNLTEHGREIFFAVNIHPSCFEKKGECIPRAKCVEKKLLYISRSCYRRDLVCCYDNTIRHPEVHTEAGTTTHTITQ